MSSIQTENYRRLEVFAKSEHGSAGAVIAKKKGTGESAIYPAGEHQYRLLKIPLEEDSEWEVSLNDCRVSIAYLSGCSGIMEQGVRYLEYRDGDWIKTDDLGKWYDTPNREQFHFNPYKNWINDPNGLCWFKGYYHLYYQANPHAQKWDHMYWGHAASRDLIHWVHLPYVLEPQEEILNARDKKGGAFSGCAVAQEDKILFYLTRHLGPSEDTEEDTVQYQTMAVSEDSLELKEENRIITKPDTTFSYNFRDPKVTWRDGVWNMVIGTRVNTVPSVVRYTSDDLLNWHYKGILMEERTEGVYTFECPDFFPVSEKKAALVGSWMFYVDEERRFQPTYYYIGEVLDGRMYTEYRGLYDFGSNFYAVQSFEHEGRRIAIGWAADSYLEHEPEENGAYGSMALPREIFLKNGKLYRKPCSEIYGQIEHCYLDVPGQKVELTHLNNNCYYAKMEFTGETDFTILLGKSEAGSIKLIRKGTQLRMKTDGVKSKYVKCITQIEHLEKIEIFVDRRMVEVFVNDGEEAGTKLFYQDKNDGIFTAEFETEKKVESIQIYGMRGIWR